MRSLSIRLALNLVILPAAAPGCAGTRLIAPEKASISQFIKIRAPHAGHLAPNGDFYYVYRHDGVRQLFRRAAGEDVGALLTHFEDGIGGYSVSHDGRWIAITAARGGDEQYDIYLMDAATDELKPLLVDRDTVFGSIVWNRTSSAFAYRANKESKADFHLYVYDVEDNRNKRVFDKSGYWYPIDFKRDGSKLLCGKYVSASESHLWEVSLIGRGARFITNPDHAWHYRGVGYAADERYVYTVTDYEFDRHRLCRIDTRSGKVEPMLPQFQAHEMSYAEVNDGRDKIAVVLNIDGYSKMHVFSLPDFKPLPLPELPEGIIGNVQFQGERLLFSVTNATTPGIIYQWPLGHPVVEPVALTEPDTQRIDVSRFRGPRLIRYRTFDDRKIPAFLYVPAGYQRGTPIPFIAYYHGGPEGQYRPGFASVFQYFLSRGFGILAPNVRGSSGYGTEFQELDNYYKRMDSVKDGVAAAQWLIDNDYSEPRKVAAYGGSYGGFMVMAVITEAPRLFGAACDMVGIVNFQTFLERTKAYRRELREAEYGPLTDSEFLKSISPIYLVDRVDTPVLIAHGKNDPRVPVHEAQQLHQALEERGKDVEMIVFADEGHGFRKEENRIEFYTKLAEFFEKHLK
jgi:dipeptidyl aminopeptidase/acylaminoacyl peptidase